MKNRELDQKIKRAFSHITPPNVLDSVLSDCRVQNDREEKGKVFLMSEKRRSPQWVKWAAGAAAVFVLLLGGGLGLQSYTIHHTVASTVSLDVNPSIEISVNHKEEVLDVAAKNADAQIVIGDMDFRGSSLDVTINALIGSMLRNGYLSEIANSILVSVDSGDPVRSAELQKKLADEIDQLLKTNTFSGSVLSQTVAADPELQQLAEEYGITSGKAQLIREITQQDTRYTFASLAALSINDLNLLHSSDVFTSDAIETVGNASDKAYIGEDRAKAAALSHAGLSEDDITRLALEFDWENGAMLYEIEFRAGSYEYSYDIDAATGAVVAHEKERDDDATHQNDQTAQNQTQDPGDPAASDQENSFITEAEAKAAALSHAGLSESEVTFLQARLSYDDGRTEYEIEFRAGSTEYDYEIDAATGRILSYDHDTEYERPAQSSGSADTQNTGTSYLSAEEAKAAAYSHAGVSDSSVSKVECELDEEDGRVCFEIEFVSGGYEYSYEIDAATGAIISHEKELDD